MFQGYIIQPMSLIPGTEAVALDLRRGSNKYKTDVVKWYKGGNYNPKDLIDADVVYVRTGNKFGLGFVKDLTRGVVKELYVALKTKRVYGIHKTITGEYRAYPIAHYHSQGIKFSTVMDTMPQHEKSNLLTQLADKMSQEDFIDAQKLIRKIEDRKKVERLSGVSTNEVVHKTWEEQYQTMKAKYEADLKNKDTRIDLLANIVTNLRKEFESFRKESKESVERLEREIEEKYKANKLRAYSAATGISTSEYVDAQNKATVEYKQPLLLIRKK